MLEKLGIKKLIMIGVTLILIVIIIFGGALLYNKLLYSKSYTEIETIMTDAAKDYFNKYEEKLPKTINNSVTVSDKTLVKYDLMKDIDSYLKKGTCDGEVTVTNINGSDYRYAATLDCRDDYQTQTLVDYINDTVDIVNNGEGLYELNNSLVYRGENVDNYLEINGNTYRIVKFVDGHPVVILTELIESISWDDHYNIITDDNSGINDYDKSKIQSYLTNMYEETGEEALFTNKTRLLLTSYDVAIGKRCNADTDKTGNLENAIALSDQYIGLLPLSDFLNASLDENCTNTNSKSCANYNYLSKFKYSWWTATANSKNTYKVYLVDENSKNAMTAKASDKAYVRPIFYLATDTIYISGDGSNDNPYKIK